MVQSVKNCQTNTHPRTTDTSQRNRVKYVVDKPPVDKRTAQAARRGAGVGSISATWRAEGGWRYRQDGTQKPVTSRAGAYNFTSIFLYNHRMYIQLNYIPIYLGPFIGALYNSICNDRIRAHFVIVVFLLISNDGYSGRQSHPPAPNWKHLRQVGSFLKMFWVKISKKIHYPNPPISSRTHPGSPFWGACLQGQSP